MRPLAMENAQKHLRLYSARERSKHPGDNEEVDADAARASGAKQLALPMSWPRKMRSRRPHLEFPPDFGA
jgi:hypothetical protein